MSLQKATDIVFGNKYHIIIPAHSNLSAFKNAKASLYFEEITNFNADTSTVTWYGGPFSNHIGWDTNYADDSFPEVFGIFFDGGHPTMGYAGVDIDNTAASFEFDCIITSSHNLTEAAKNNILNYIYAEVYTELIPYLKQIKENIISITPLKDNQLLHIKVPAHTKFDPSYSYLILNGIPSNINTRLTPVFYNDMRPGEYVFGACNYSDYYAQFGLYYTIVDTNWETSTPGQFYWYNLYDAEYDFECDISYNRFSAGMNVTSVSSYFPFIASLNAPINAQDLPNKINALKPSGQKTITSSGSTNVAGYETAYVQYMSISNGTSQGSGGLTTITPTKFPYYVNLSAGYRTATSIRINSPTNLTAANIKKGITIAGVAGSYEGSTPVGIPADFSKYGADSSSAAAGISNTSSSSIWFMTDTDTNWIELPAGADASVTFNYHVWVKFGIYSSDIRSYTSDRTIVDAIYGNRSGTRLFYKVSNNKTISSIVVSNWSCLRGDTLVTMADGSYKRLDDIELGDMILAYDWSTMKLGAHEVLKTNKYDANNWVDESTLYKFDDGTEIEVMNHHKFYNVEHKCFMNMSEWQIGEHTLKEDGTHPALVSTQELHERKQHYTLSILGGVNYFANGLISGDSIAPKDIDLEIAYEGK